MRARIDNSLSQYAFIACLSIALLFTQAFNMHRHIQHDDGAASAGHIADVHVAASLHDTHHQDDHHATAIDLSTDSYVKKAEMPQLFLLLFFIASIVLCAPRLLCIHRRYLHKIKSVSLYYLLHPPLRAPPA